MRNDKIQKSNWGADGHPSTELLRQYEEGILSSALSNELERHLMDCELCEDVLTGMTLVDRTRTQQAKSRILQRIRTRLRRQRKSSLALNVLADWRVAVAILMMFCSLGLLLFYHYTTTIAEQKSGHSALKSGQILPPSPEELLARTIDSALVLEIQAPPPAPVYDLPAKSAASATDFTADKKTVGGRVLSNGGEPLPDVLVQVKGSTISTLTDRSGNFRFQLPQDRHALLFSLPGFKPQEIAIGSSSQAITVRLEKGK
ncbi:TonB-dependent receptor [Pontibacter sp. HJ8]